MQEMRRENEALGNRVLNDRLENPDVFEPIISRSPKMRVIFQYLESVALSSQPLLISGESGTGKGGFSSLSPLTVPFPVNVYKTLLRLRPEYTV